MPEPFDAGATGDRPPAAESTPAIDLTTPRRVHVVGIGGAGMSAIAVVLAAMGHHVTGSDLKASTGLERLRVLGIDVRVGHAASQVGDVDAVAVSTAIAPTNPEVRAAIDRAIPVLRRAEILSAIAATRRTVAISGTHGKTTTSSMLALVLVEAGLRPSFIVGGELNEIGSGAVWDSGDWFVVEADESDGTFVELGAEIAVVTNVEADHLDYYGTLDRIEAAFDRFLSEAPGPNLVCVDEPHAAVLAAVHGTVTYGTSESADYRIVDAVVARSGVRFQVIHHGESLGAPIELPVPGLHNARNATAALVAGLLVGVPYESARRALARYAGVARRFEFRGANGGVTFVDDYAHNPGKVAAVLAAARAGGWGRIVAVFQPHRYTRTASLWPDFADSFVDADVVVLTDVYAAGERPQPGISGKLVLEAVLDAHPRQRVVWIPHRQELARFLSGELRPGDLCLGLGAGDITSLADEVMALLGDEEGAA